MDTDDRADHQIALLCEAIDQIDGQIDALWCEVGGQDPAQRSYPKWIGQEFDRLHADRDHLEAQLTAFRAARKRVA